MRPDNNHLHNQVHHWYRKVFKSKNIANSASGLSIAAASSGIVLFGYYANWWPMTSHQWIWVFFSQCVLYLMTFYFTRPTSPVNKSAEV